MVAFALAGQTFYRWKDHEGQRLGAALAFYVVLSGAPLLTFILLALSAFYGQHMAEENIVSYTRTIIGTSAANLTQDLLINAQNSSHSLLAGIVALFTLTFGASGAFNELREALNKMWDVHARCKGFVGMLFKRAFAFVLVVASGALMFAVVLASTAITLVRRVFPASPIRIEVANFVFSFAAFTLLFVLIYRFVPDLVLPWKVLWTGAAVTAFLFVIGKALVGLYLANAGIGSAHGAAGSLIAIAFWVYYSAQIFLLGAQFTYVWSARFHSPIVTGHAAGDVSSSNDVLSQRSPSL